MRLLLAVVVFGVAGVLLTQSMVGNAISVVEPRRIAETSFRFAAMIMGAYNSEARVKRQVNPKCIVVVTNYTSNPNFTACQRGFVSLGNFSSLTHAQIEDFCSRHCPSLVLNAFHAIEMACGPGIIPGGETVSYYREILLQSCRHFGGKTCLERWGTANTTFSLTDRNNYQNCLQSYKDAKDCPSSCHQVLPLVNKNLGCCFRAIDDFENTPQGNHSLYLPDSVFKECHLQAPVNCTR